MLRKGCFIFLVSIVVIACRSADNKQDKLIRAAENLGARSPLADISIFPRIYIDQYDTITVNGRRSNIEEIDKLLKEVKQKNGIVLYSSYNITDEIPKEGRVIELVRKYHMSIRTYSDSTFSKPYQ